MPRWHPSDYLFHTSVYIFWEEQLKEHPVRQNQESPIIHHFPCLFKGMPRCTNIAVYLTLFKTPLTFLLNNVQKYCNFGSARLPRTTFTSHNVFWDYIHNIPDEDYLDIHIKVSLNIAHLIVSIFILYLPLFLFVFVGFVFRICQDLYPGRRGPPASLAAHSSWPESSRHEHRLQMRFEQLSGSLNTLSSEHSFSKYFFSEHFFL